MFESIEDVKNYIAETARKYSKQFVTDNYSIEYSNRLKRSLGSTRTRYLFGVPIEIKFVFNNKYLLSFEKNSEDIINTVLHEMAHAIAGNHHHHDAYWKQCCCRIGARPERFTSVEY